jgi:hypothetical protein
MGLGRINSLDLLANRPALSHLGYKNMKTAEGYLEGSEIILTGRLVLRNANG